jgi:hypothetical protein
MAAENLATSMMIIMITIMMMIMLIVYSSLLQERERDTKSGTYIFGEGIHMKGTVMCRIKAVFSRTIHFFRTTQHTAYVEPNKEHISHVQSIVPRPVR